MDTDLDGQTCETQGFDTGTLACESTCDFDTTGCDYVCGNNSIGNTEVCDGTDLGGASCLSQGYSNAAGAVCAGDCGSVDYTGCAPTCGDGSQEPGEDCDTGGASATCDSDCTAVVCGDGICNAAANENDVTCDVDCDPICGNGVIEGNEGCDGSDFGSETCETQNFDSGVLGCTAFCVINTSACEYDCGNNSANGTEVCDGTDLVGADCTDEDYSNAAGAVCAADCASVDYSGCAAACGDGFVEPGEECDGNGLGVGGENALCDADCTAVGCGDGVCNISALENGANCPQDCNPVCGNDVIEGGEACDNLLLGANTCETEGFDSGALACAGDCSFDTSGCSYICGNNSAGGTEVCDLNDLRNANCTIRATPIRPGRRATLPAMRSTTTDATQAVVTERSSRARNAMTVAKALPATSTAPR